MIDGEVYPEIKEPITLRLRNGLFYGDFDGMGEIVAMSIEGRFEGIGKTRYKGFPYFYLQLRDETNTIRYIMQPQSANLKDIVLSMVGERFTDVYMEAHTIGRRWSRIKLYLDNERFFPHFDGYFPRIRRVRDGKGKPWHCDYGDRIRALEGMITDINETNQIQPIHISSRLADLKFFL